MIGRLRGLRTRLVASVVGVSVLAAALVGTVAVQLRRSSMLETTTREVTERLTADLDVAAAEVNRTQIVVREPGANGEDILLRVLDEPDLAVLGDELTRASPRPVLIVQPGGGERFRSHLDRALVPPAELEDVVRQGLIGRVRTVLDGRPTLVVGARVAADSLAIYRFEDLGPIDDELAALTRTVLVAGAAPVVVATLVGRFVAGRLVRPLRRARDGARRFGEGALATRLPVDGDDELADLSRSFNVMAASLERTVVELREVDEQQRRFVADVSHELRTPLTALVAAVEVLDDDALGGADPDRREATRLALDEVRAMRDLVEDLVEISRFDAGHAALQEGRVDLRDAVTASLRRRGWDAVGVAVPAGTATAVDPRRLDTVVANLVGNAFRHGAPPIEIRVHIEGADVALDVIDAGTGVPGHVRSRLFERFVKADASRTRSGGSGLGLSIARENARLHGGDVTVLRTGPGGTVMRLTLPGRHVRPGADVDPDAEAHEGREDGRA